MASTDPLDSQAAEYASVAVALKNGSGMPFLVSCNLVIGFEWDTLTIAQV